MCHVKNLSLMQSRIKRATCSPTGYDLSLTLPNGEFGLAIRALSGNSRNGRGSFSALRAALYPLAVFRIHCVIPPPPLPPSPTPPLYRTAQTSLTVSLFSIFFVHLFFTPSRKREESGGEDGKIKMRGGKRSERSGPWWAGRYSSPRRSLRVLCHTFRGKPRDPLAALGLDLSPRLRSLASAPSFRKLSFEENVTTEKSEGREQKKQNRRSSPSCRRRNDENILFLFNTNQKLKIIKKNSIIFYWYIKTQVIEKKLIHG